MSMGHFGSKFSKLEDTAWTNVITDHPPSGRCGYLYFVLNYNSLIQYQSDILCKWLGWRNGFSWETNFKSKKKTQGARVLERACCNHNNVAAQYRI